MSTYRPFRDDAHRGGHWAIERRRDQGATVAELDDLLVHGGAAVVATDLDGVITHWSAGAERLYGWSGDEAIGVPLLELVVTPRDQQLAEEIMERVQHNGSWEGEFDVRCSDGSIVLAYMREALIKDDAGRPVGILGLSMDVAAPPRTA
jgi:PAS domain S-box-containing protein